MDEEYQPYVIYDDRKVFVVSNSGKTVQEYEFDTVDEALIAASKFREQIEKKISD